MSYTYFRSLLDPAYEKIKAKLKSQLKQDIPKYCAISVDAWSAHHHGYMGINVHYIHNFVRKMHNLACSPFDKRHTGKIIFFFWTFNPDAKDNSLFFVTAENIWKLIKSVLDDWELFLVVMIALRDGAANMIKAFQEAGCSIEDLHCLIHGLQLVVCHELLH